ncbi:carbohydrate ABC transporter permease [Clostridium thermarum]|uniref:carbohydrate ABC transporter permease n=1 Tax=Clostridium thermarum TaxID=1716543 RepID=UPI003C12C4CD
MSYGVVKQTNMKPNPIRKGINILNSKKVAPYIFVLPFILSFLIFFLYPLISTVIMSFQKILGPGEVEFIGFKNYSKLFNKHFLNAIFVTTRYTFWTILVLVPLPIIIAVLLNNKLTFAKNFFRASLFIPALTSVIVAGLFFRLVFGEQSTTLVNFILGKFGIEPIVWLQGKHTGMFVLVLLCTWRWLGVNVVYFLSGLQTIPAELYEAAAIDGANEVQKFRHITMPGLRPVITYVVTISVYGGYSMFAESYALWSGPRSPGEIGMTIVNYIYHQGFNQNDLGFGSAIGIVLLLLVMLVNILQLSATGFFKKESD